mgnify:CR=1 FL=1
MIDEPEASAETRDPTLEWTAGRQGHENVQFSCRIIQFSRSDDQFSFLAFIIKLFRSVVLLNLNIICIVFIDASEDGFPY